MKFSIGDRVAVKNHNTGLAGWEGVVTGVSKSANGYGVVLDQDPYKMPAHFGENELIEA